MTKRYFLSIFWSCAGLMQVNSTFWAATHPLPRAERATIPHMKEEMQGFHMNQISKIFFVEKGLFSALSQSKSAAPRTVTEYRQTSPHHRASRNGAINPRPRPPYTEKFRCPRKVPEPRLFRSGPDTLPGLLLSL